jgi:cell division transport system permease protein
MTDPIEREEDPEAGAADAAGPIFPDAQPSFESPLVPKATIAGRALAAVVAIMTFLAALTTGAVMMVRAMASDWQSEVAREVTIQIRATPGRDLDADIARAAAIARAVPGIADVRPYSKEESARLLEPWLGSGLALDELPVPRLIVVRLAAGAAPDLDPLRRRLADEVASASLDDHRGFVDRMRAMTRTAVIVGVGVLLLVLAATVLSVTFATRGAMATNRAVIEVLHFIGAKENFISGHFQRHFLALGLKGGAIGGGAAVALVALAEFVGRWTATPAGDGALALFGSFSIGWTGYLAMLLQVILVAGVTTLTARVTVNRTLATIH